MANAHGGMVLLGVREKNRQFSVAGIENVEKVRTDLFNNLNNRAKVSANVLADEDVTALTLEGKTVLAIRIPAATRKQKPVFLNGQPLGQTYRRLHDGDRHCDDDTVRRMLAEQLDDSRDTRILDKFGLADLDLDSLHAYRNVFTVHRRDHPWLAVDDETFLRRIGGWGTDRSTGEQGLTLAGLLMFGQLQGGDRLVGSVMMTAFFPGVWCAWLLWRAGSSLVRGERHRADFNQCGQDTFCQPVL